MREDYFTLTRQEQKELLETAAMQSGRAPHLLEKDIWVVWVLSVLFSSSIRQELTFKGGTSLSKAYKAIDRFSEDIDLTYSIHHIIGDLVGDNAYAIPSSASQSKKWTKAVRDRLPGWIDTTVKPVIEDALTDLNISAELAVTGREHDSLLLSYDALHRGTGYIAPQIRLEFGARSTGEPREPIQIQCDLQPFFPEIHFPTATPLVMSMERTFWEKVTAAHVFCKQGRMRGERFARHWHDIYMLSQTERLRASFPAKECGKLVVAHKSMFFAEKDEHGEVIDYNQCISGSIQIVPGKKLRELLRDDYFKMVEDGVLLHNTITFDCLLEKCTNIENNINNILSYIDIPQESKRLPHDGREKRLEETR